MVATSTVDDSDELNPQFSAFEARSFIVSAIRVPTSPHQQQEDYIGEMSVSTRNPEAHSQPLPYDSVYSPTLPLVMESNVNVRDEEQMKSISFSWWLRDSDGALVTCMLSFFLILYALSAFYDCQLYASFPIILPWSSLLSDQRIPYYITITSIAIIARLLSIVVRLLHKN